MHADPSGHVRMGLRKKPSPDPSDHVRMGLSSPDPSDHVRMGLSSPDSSGHVEKKPLPGNVLSVEMSLSVSMRGKMQCQSIGIILSSSNYGRT